MKKLVFLLAITLTISACIKPNRICCVLAQPENSMAANINSNGWAPTLVDTVKDDSITIYGSTTTDYIRLKFNYKVTPQQTNVIIKDYSATYFTRMSNGQILNSYVLDKSVPDTLEIVYPVDAKLISGGFHLKFKIQKSGNGDTSSVSFSNGRFTALLNK